ncbi:MAG: alcohol dehydrogenase catalytic domain-containing protein [Chloroflexia bacterium]
MRSVVLEAPETIQVAEGPEPTVSQGEARVRLRSGGVCGSDLAAYRGISPHATYPLVLGHELLVDVLECADRPDIVGTRAVVEPLLRCGKCRACRRGRYNCCVHLRTLGVHTTAASETRRRFPPTTFIPCQMRCATAWPYWQNRRVWHTMLLSAREY